MFKVHQCIHIANFLSIYSQKPKKGELLHLFHFQPNPAFLQALIVTFEFCFLLPEDRFLRLTGYSEMPKFKLKHFNRAVPYSKNHHKTVMQIMRTFLNTFIDKNFQKILIPVHYQSKSIIYSTKNLHQQQGFFNHQSHFTTIFFTSSLTL